MNLRQVGNGRKVLGKRRANLIETCDFFARFIYFNGFDVYIKPIGVLKRFKWSFMQIM